MPCLKDEFEVQGYVVSKISDSAIVDEIEISVDVVIICQNSVVQNS